MDYHTKLGVLLPVVQEILKDSEDLLVPLLLELLYFLVLLMVL